MQWPWMAATVTALMASIASAMSRPASAASRTVRPWLAAGSPKEARSAPAENDRPAPDTTTAFTAGCASNQWAAATNSSSVVVPRGLSFSGRSSVRCPTPPSAVAWMVVNSAVGT